MFGVIKFRKKSSVALGALFNLVLINTTHQERRLASNGETISV